MLAKKGIYMFKGKTLLITGGTGSFSNAITPVSKHDKTRTDLRR
jgi:FlaA1/EpsC-like NDP-sugar epimerase